MNELSPSLAQFENFDFRELPIGVYMVNQDGQFIVCNRTLRQMFGLPLEGPVKANIKQFYADLSDRENLIRQALVADGEGQNLERALIHFRANGHDLFVEDYCKPLRNPITGEVLGFVGCLADITNEHENALLERESKQRVDELTFDIGRILHANTTTLVMVIQSLNSVIQAFASNPFQGDSVPSIDEIDAALTKHADQLATAIDRFVNAGDEARRAKALPEHKWKQLVEHGIAVREFKLRVPVPESRPAVLRVAAHTITLTSHAIKPGSLPKETVRDLQQAAWHMERLTTLIDVLKTRSAVLQMDYTLHSLREYVTTDARETSKQIKVPVKHLIDESIARLTTYAQSSRIEIKSTEIIEGQVVVNEREMIRAFSNLLHNAIKYTWRRDQTKASWVSIHVRIQNREIFIEFENWGVPISEEELNQGLIFKLGYRGKWSTDRGRLGTGIGLTDAQRIAQSHGGGILIDSKPTRIFSQTDPEYFRQPFLTKVSLYLPLAGE